MPKYLIDSADSMQQTAERLHAIANFLTAAMDSLEEVRKHLSGYVTETREARDRLLEEIVALEARLERGIEQ